MVCVCVEGRGWGGGAGLGVGAGTKRFHSQMHHFMVARILYTIYQFIKPLLDNKMFIFEEYGAFKDLKGL